MASDVTSAPVIRRRARRLGMAVISLDLISGGCFLAKDEALAGRPG